MTVLVYDSGALIAAEHDDKRLWLIHQRALGRSVVPIVPAVVLAESSHPAMRNLGRLLMGCEVERLDAAPALMAASLRHATANGTVVDAVVVETALRRQATVLTSDREDVEALAASANRKISVIDI